MKIECVKDKLRDAVMLAEKLTGKNMALPILNAVLLIAEDSSVKIRATNLDLGIEITVPVKVLKEGIAAIPGSVFSQLLSNSFEKTVVCELTDGNMRITTNNSSTTIKSSSYEDFPTLPAVRSKNPFVIASKKFISGLKSVLYSASVSDAKPELASVYLSYDQGYLVCAATDSFRLAERKIAVTVKEAFPPTLIPGKNVAEIIRIFDRMEGDMEIHFDNHQLSVSLDGIYVTSRVIDGVFPDYKQILPKGHTTEVVILKQDLVNAIKVSNVFSDKLNHVDFDIQPKKKLFEIRSRNFDIGENSTRVDA
ncbi:MAG: DNA polymerase III subunit beta, partial [Patescibacteria group bacterium]